MTTKPIKSAILHFRQWRLHKDGGLVLKNNGGYTVLIKRKGDKYEFTYARCGKQDNFNKHIGIAIVEGRMRCEKKIEARMELSHEQMVKWLLKKNEQCHERYTAAFLHNLLTKLT